MALKPTIYKFRVALSDFDKDYYDSQSVTVALHPSETMARMLARVLSYCYYSYKNQEFEQDIRFTKGLSTVEEPDLWSHSLDGQIVFWLDVGEPAPERLKKAKRLSQACCVVSFNSKSDTWWKQNQAQFASLETSVIQLDHAAIQIAADSLQRGTELAVNISDNQIYIASDGFNGEIAATMLQGQR